MPSLSTWLGGIIIIIGVGVTVICDSLRSEKEKKAKLKTEQLQQHEQLLQS
jgi:putative Mn2+ efflux pump MntP